MTDLHSTSLNGGSGERVPALEARNVVKRYGEITALDDISLSVRDGELVALVGESGSGKTTLLRSFNRMTDPDSGRVLVAGRDARSVDPVELRRSTGYVQQEGGLLPHWTVLRNVTLVPRLRQMEEPERLAREALGRVGLPPETFEERWPRELSGGQRQRVALARALAARPGVILLDEPFGALDAITRADLREGFGKLRHELGITTVLVTHDLREALSLADRVAVLYRGGLQQVADPVTLRTAPASPYVAHLLERAEVVEG